MFFSIYWPTQFLEGLRMLLRPSRTTPPKYRSNTKVKNVKQIRNVKILVHAQVSCACTGVLCMHKNLVHAQESGACTRFLCTRFLCMHRIIVHALESCARARFLCMHKNLVHVSFNVLCDSNTVYYACITWCVMRM